jgi:predicted amidophosphoribosyltransferase
MPTAKTTRLDRERHTIRTMIAMYCRDHHGSGGALCADCEQLHGYAMLRIDKCPYSADKPTCAKCPTHCYKPDRREEVRAVMRYAGPRMLLRHPVLTLLHYWDEYRSADRIAATVAAKADRARAAADHS